MHAPPLLPPPLVNTHRPYPFEQRAAWINLTNCVSESVLERCGIPLGAKVLAGSSAAEQEEEEKVIGSARSTGSSSIPTLSLSSSAAVVGMELVPHFPHVGRVAHFCELPVKNRVSVL